MKTIAKCINLVRPDICMFPELKKPRKIINFKNIDLLI